MQFLKVWSYILWQTIKPYGPSWVVIVLPLVVAIAAILYLRSRSYPQSGVWRETGRRWKLVGTCLIIVVTVTYLTVPLATMRYRAEQVRRLTDMAQRLQLWKNKDQVRELARLMDEESLRDFCKSYTDGLDKTLRQNVVEVWTSSDLRTENTIHYGGANFFGSLDPGVAASNNMVRMAELIYDKPQHAYFQRGNWRALHESLRPAQWHYLMNQFFDPPTMKDGMVDILANMCDSLPAQNIASMKFTLGNLTFGGSSIKNLAFLLQPQAVSEKVVRVLVTYHNWLREIVWLLLWSGIGSAVLIKGRKIMREGRQDPFGVGITTAKSN